MKRALKVRSFAICTLLTCVFCASAYSQDCGAWVKDSTYCESWISIDTINYNSKADTTWTYTEWQYALNPARAYLVYCPCGCGYDDWEIRKRVNAVGIIQQQKRVTTYKYIESDFEKRVKQLKNAR